MCSCKSSLSGFKKNQVSSTLKPCYASIPYIKQFRERVASARWKSTKDNFQYLKLEDFAIKCRKIRKIFSSMWVVCVEIFATFGSKLLKFAIATHNKPIFQASQHFAAKLSNFCNFITFFFAMAFDSVNFCRINIYFENKILHSIFKKKTKPHYPALDIAVKQNTSGPRLLFPGE